MYRRCVFCAGDLGANEVVEPFPVGRRLAFDAAKGRLWVVCRACERWNLSPLEERWEAIEECERRFRETRLRASTENVGLARLSEGLELVRLGAPRRPEFAAWRYGDQFGRRRRKFVLQTAVGAGIVGGIAIGSAGLAGLSVAMHVGNLARLAYYAARPPARLYTAGRRVLELKHTQVSRPRLRPSDEAEGGWRLEVPHRDGKEILTGAPAVNALELLLPRVNISGASKTDVRTAVREIEDVGHPHAYFAAAEHRARKRGMGHMTLGGLPRPIRLALEMAANEDGERRALEGELALLERAWHEAERLAAIADELTIGDRILQRLRQIRRDTGA